MQWTFYLEKLHGSSVFVPGATLKMRKGSPRSFPASNENKTETLLTGKICFSKRALILVYLLKWNLKCFKAVCVCRTTVNHGVPHNALPEPFCTLIDYLPLKGQGYSCRNPYKQTNKTELVLWFECLHLQPHYMLA